MKRKITFSLFLAALILPAALNAAVVDVFTAKQAAKNFYYARNYQTVKSYESISLQTLLVRNEAAQPVYYIFSTPEKGFVIMAADDAVTPVLGYSFTSDINLNDNSPAFDSWMQTYVDIIMLSRQNGTEADATIKNAWASLMNPASAIESQSKGGKVITPLLVTTWNQDKYYNELAPADPASNADGHAYAGCVATTMGQIMNYFKYPKNGNGSKTYNANNAYLGYGDYGSLTANFGATWYEWNGMPNNLIERNIPVATLLYHAGVSVSMMYGPNASGAQSTSVAPALVNYFRYKNTLTLISRDTYANDTRWKDSLKSSLNRQIPIYYSGDGNASGTGHAFVCDGYDASDMFHFNWGWSGSADGYFAVTAVSPSGYNFTYHQSALINISPITTAYPYYCSGTDTLSWTAGTFEDGSSPQKNYYDNSDCRWLISVPGANKISISFDRFAVESMDTVIIYNGATTSSTVLARYTGATIPASIQSTSGDVLVRFKTNSSGNDEGWYASYQAYFPLWCSGTTDLTNVQDTIEDGSGPYNYTNNSSCQWLIHPANATQITLHFLEFDIEQNKDFVKVFNAQASTLIQTLTGNTLPNDVSCNCNSMRVQFTTNTSNTYPGFKAYYTIITGMEEMSGVDNLSLYPNPADKNFNFSFSLQNSELVSIKLSNILGEEMMSIPVQKNMAQYNQQVDVSNLSSGVYFLNVTTTKGVNSVKLVLE